MEKNVDKNKLLVLAKEWEEIWQGRPFENSNGLGCQGAFALYYFLKEMDPAPEFVVECGTWRGFSTWVIKMAVPDAKIVCSDPILASRQFLNKSVFTPEYRIEEAEYTWQDFSNIEIYIPEEKRERAVVFFDDHQNKLPRLKQAVEKGFKHIIYDDNVPYKYTHTSFEYLFNVEGNESAKKYFKRYEVFPPVYSAMHKSGTQLNGIIKINDAYFKDFFEEKEGYSWVTKVEVLDSFFERSESCEKINNVIELQKIIHICFNNIHVQPLVDEIDNINVQAKYKHEVYIARSRSIPDYDVDLSKSKEAVFFNENNSLNSILKKCLHEDVKSIIFHGLFFDWQKRLVKSIGLNKKLVWIMWGGDLYNPVSSGHIDMSIYSNFDAVSTGVEGDYDFFLKNYAYKPLIPYKHASSVSLNNIMVPEEKDNSIIIGNSGDPSNNHLEIIEAVSNKIDKNNFKYILPFAYNGTPAYLKNIKDALLDAGIYGQCTFIEKMLPPEEYFSIIAKSKGVITAHNRQQAVGNISASLYFGNFTVVREKYVINGTVDKSSVWLNFEEKGVEGLFSFERFFDADRILPFANFPKTQKNRAVIESVFDRKNYISSIKEIEEKIDLL